MTEGAGHPTWGRGDTTRVGVLGSRGALGSALASAAGLWQQMWSRAGPGLQSHCLLRGLPLDKLLSSFLFLVFFSFLLKKKICLGIILSFLLEVRFIITEKVVK